MSETQVTPPTRTPAAPPKSGRGLRIALAISVALNLAVAGLVTGAVLRDGPGGPPGMVRDLGFGPFSEALSREDRQALRKSLIDRAPDLRQARRQMRDDMQAILAALRAEPFDPEALSALMDGQHVRMAAQLKLGEELIRDFLLGMDVTSRHAFADRLEAKLMGKGPDHQGGPEGHGARDTPKAP